MSNVVTIKIASTPMADFVEVEGPQTELSRRIVARYNAVPKIRALVLAAGVVVEKIERRRNCFLCSGRGGRHFKTCPGPDLQREYYDLLKDEFLIMSPGSPTETP